MTFDLINSSALGQDVMRLRTSRRVTGVLLVGLGARTQLLDDLVGGACASGGRLPGSVRYLGAVPARTEWPAGPGMSPSAELRGAPVLHGRPAPETDLEPQADQVRRFLDSVTDDALGSSVEHEQPAEEGAWVATGHSGNWAAHSAGRTRTVPSAQRLDPVGRPVTDAPQRVLARRVWDAVSGTGHAFVSSELLDDAASAAVTGRFFASDTLR